MADGQMDGKCTSKNTAIATGRSRSTTLRRRSGSQAVARMARLVVLVMVPSLLMFEVGGTVRAQLPATNPLVVPPLPPSPPAQLPAPVTTAIAPPPLTIPTLPAAYSTPGPRVFNCGCFGPGRATAWIGQVTNSSYFGASQMASGACTSYVTQKTPRYGFGTIAGAANNYGPLPGVAQNSSGVSNSGVGPGGEGAGAANNYSGIVGVTQNAGGSKSYGPLPGALNSSALSCTYCSCD